MTRETVPAAGERLSGMDSAFLYLETPKTHMHVAMVALLDASELGSTAQVEAIHEHIAERAPHIPEFRRKLLPVPFGMGHPLWIDDPDLEVIQHVRRASARAPGGLRELAEVSARIASSPLSRERPLWEIWIIDGLEDEKVAILIKLHHANVDGASAVKLLGRLFDGTPEGCVSESPPPPAQAAPNRRKLFEDAARHRLGHPGVVASLALRTARVIGDLAARRLEAKEVAGATPLTAPASLLNAPIEGERAVAFARIPLDGILRIRRAEGVSVNDVILAVTAGALRRYLEEHQALPDDALTAIIPVAIGSGPDKKGTNHVSALFTSLATDEKDPLRRLQIIAKSTRGAKSEHKQFGARTLESWANATTPSTYRAASRLYTRLGLGRRIRPVTNLIVSNVAGPRKPLYMAGAELVAAYPMGPVLAGSGLNVTAFTYRDHIDFGFMAAANVLPDVWSLADAVSESYVELLELSERINFAEEPAGAGSSRERAEDVKVQRAMPRHS